MFVVFYSMVNWEFELFHINHVLNFNHCYEYYRNVVELASEKADPNKSPNLKSGYFLYLLFF